ncbi:MAG: DUF4835 family protein [Saprospiraceae bacterium]
MKSLKIVILINFLLVVVIQNIIAQELDMNVVVVAPNSASASDKSVFPIMEKAIKDLVNNQKWTNDNFESNERIKCKLQLNIRTDYGNNSFTCDLILDASRPVFGSSYETTLLVITEKDIPINFDPFKPLENSKETYYDNLSALITFYSYFILAMDYDSFSLEGGDSYITLLQNMVNTIPSGAKQFDESWSSASKKKNSRYFLLDNLANIRMKPFRRANYEYHRLCMDNFSKTPESSRSNIVNAIEAVADTDQTYPNSFLMQSFIGAKKNEIVEIFKQGTQGEKERVITAMSAIDPSNSSLYNSIKS